MQGQEKSQACGQRKRTIFTMGDVLELKSELELKTGSRLNLTHANPCDITLTCQNLERYHCGFKYLFRKSPEDPQKAEYILLTEFQSHQLECLNENSAIPRRKTDVIASPSFKRYKPDPQLPLQTFSPKLFSLSEKNQPSEKSQVLQKSLLQECLMLRQKHSTKLYTEDEVGALKKQLQFESKGLISKSTEFHGELGYITKISFRCKYDSGNCPYLSTLTYTYERNDKNQKLYRLDKIHILHGNSCILDTEQIHFNFITRKIDENFDLLVQILKDNSPDIKPKRVLDLFTEALGEQPDFIYQGIDSKNNKRAAKKYFDNSVAKARNTIKDRN